MKEQIIAKLKAADSERVWNAVCDEAKRYAATLPESERSGDYPAWWFRDVILAGITPKF